jgi:hypothetical protein
MRVLLALALVPLPALADPGPPLTGAAFEAYTTGRTLTYALGGQVFGTEQYLPGRRVMWAFAEDRCQRGTWYEEAEFICFVYEDEPGNPQCWTFHLDDGRLLARFAGDAPGSELAEVAQSDKPLNCPGPDVGV